MSQPDEKVNLIFGCGYLGKTLARQLLANGETVYGTTRSQHNAAALHEFGVRPLILDVTQRLTLAAVADVIQSPGLTVYYMIPPGRPSNDPSPREVVINGISNVVSILGRASLSRAVLVSSTSVYGRSDGGVVSADTQADSQDARGKLLSDGEEIWLAASDKFHVVRMAGLYGPGRVIGQSAVSQGAPIIGNPDAMLNLIHIEDAADLLRAVATNGKAGRVELGCDNEPVARGVYYNYLAARLGMAPPKVLDDEEAARRFDLNLARLRRSSSKRCDNSPTRDRLGWQPKFANYQQGLEGLLPPSLIPSS